MLETFFIHFFFLLPFSILFPFSWCSTFKYKKVQSNTVYRSVEYRTVFILIVMIWCDKKLFDDDECELLLCCVDWTCQVDGCWLMIFGFFVCYNKQVNVQNWRILYHRGLMQINDKKNIQLVCWPCDIIILKRKRSRSNFLIISKKCMHAPCLSRVNGLWDGRRHLHIFLEVSSFYTVFLKKRISNSPKNRSKPRILSEPSSSIVFLFSRIFFEDNMMVLWWYVTQIYLCTFFWYINVLSYTLQGKSGIFYIFIRKKKVCASV